MKPAIEIEKDHFRRLFIPIIQTTPSHYRLYQGTIQDLKIVLKCTDDNLDVYFELTNARGLVDSLFSVLDNYPYYLSGMQVVNQKIIYYFKKGGRYQIETYSAWVR